MKPQQLKDKLYVSVKRGDTTMVCVGIRLEAILTLDSDKEEDIEAATEQGRNDIVEGVYGGMYDQLLRPINDLLSHSQPEVNEEQEYYQARQELRELMKNLS